MSQSRIVMETPEIVLAAAAVLGPFVGRYALTSGGRDSSVVAHLCRDAYDELVFIDTGTALPGTVEHVQATAAWIGKPLRILATPADEYDRLVLGSDLPRGNGKPDVGAGFPGPAMHGSCYTRLKERRLEDLTRAAKVGHRRSARILLLTGIRREESPRRRGRAAVTRKAARVFANPIIDWAGADVREYADREGAPVSEASALLHRSGECNCGAFAAPGEREMLRSLYPSWWDARIAPLEKAAAAAGYGDRAVWGHGIRGGERIADPADLDSICGACEQITFDAELAPA